LNTSTYPHVVKVTVSIGFSSIISDEPSSRLIDRADRALYYAKNHDRNQSLCDEDLIVNSLLQETGDIELF